MLTINGVRLDDPLRPYIVAEASGNHHQDYDAAVALTVAAAEAGADAVKWQLITPELICADIPLPFGHNVEHDAWCQNLGVTRMRELFAHGGLPRAWCAPLKSLAEQLELSWLCTPFSLEEARFLVEEIHVPAIKIASGDLTFTPLLAYAARTGLPIILSTGMATVEEIRTALQVIDPDEYCERVALLHCRSVYPCPEESMNLRALEYMRCVFACGAYGLSDHTTSCDVVPALAVALGCTVYEKHVRLEEDSTSIDAGHSLSPRQFRQMVDVIRAVPKILGEPAKHWHALEAHERLWTRRGSDGLRPTDEAREGRWQ